MVSSQSFVCEACGCHVDTAPNFFSFHTDGAGWTAGLGSYAYRTLGWRRAVVIVDLKDDLFNWTQAAGFVAEFCSLGGSITQRIWVPAGIRDYSSVVAELPNSGVDGIFMATFSDRMVARAKVYPGLAGDISRRLIPGSFADDGRLKTLGKRTDGIVGGGAAGAGDWDAYAHRLHQAFPEVRPTEVGYFDIFYHDAMAATLAALTTVQGDVSDRKSVV